MVLSVAKYELKMQLRRKYVWILAVLFLLIIFFLTSPFNEPGLVFSSRRLAAHSLFLSLLFSTLLFAFLVSDRISRDDELLMGELIRSAPVEPFQYVIGKMIGSAIYFLLLFMLPVLLLMQVMYILFSGFEDYDLLSFLKIYSFFPFPSAFFIAGVAFYVSRLFGDNMKFFIVFAAVWALLFLLAMSGPMGALSIFDFTGKFAGQVLLADRFSLPGVKGWTLFALNICFLLGVGIVCALLLARHLQRETVVPQRRTTVRAQTITQIAPVIGYSKEIVQWKNLKVVIAFIVITSVILLKTFQGSTAIVISYLEIFLPLLFAFTTTHVFKAEQGNRVMEFLLTKPISRFKLLSQRYLLLIAPNIFMTVAVSLIIRLFHRPASVGWLLSLSLPVMLFLCTLSLTIAVVTRASGLAAAGAGGWALLWINGDIQRSISPGGWLFLINPFAETFHPGSGSLMINKLTLLALSGLLFLLAVLVLRRSERFLQ